MWKSDDELESFEKLSFITSRIKLSIHKSEGLKAMENRYFFASLYWFVSWTQSYFVATSAGAGTTSTTTILKCSTSANKGE